MLVVGVLGIIMFSICIHQAVAFEIPSIEWTRTYGGELSDSAWSVQQTTDGGYVFVGDTTSRLPKTKTTQTDILIIKTDAVGNVQWKKTYGGPKTDDGRYVQQTKDGGYIIAGFTYSFGAGNNDAWLIKVDANGNSEWTKTYGGKGFDAARRVQQTDDAGYIFVGWTGIRTWPDVWLVKIDQYGAVEWEKTFGGPKSDYGFFVEQTNDGGYIIAGETWSFAVGYSDAWAIKTDSNGNVEWSKTYNTGLEDIAYSVLQTDDGGYVLAGSTYTAGTPYADFWLVKTDSQGNQQWIKTFGGALSEEARSVVQTDDGGYLLAGYTKSFGAGNEDVWLVKVDSNGNEQWNQTFGGKNTDWAMSIQQTMEGGYIVAGHTKSFGVGGDAWLIKICLCEQTEASSSTSPFSLFRSMAILKTSIFEPIRGICLE